MTVRIHAEVDFALSWVVDETMERASHAVVDDGRVWLIDPVADEQALERAAALGEPAGVVQLLDRHERDGAAVAQRLGVPLLPLPGVLAGSPFEVVPLIDRRWWHEVALWWPARRTLIVPEAVGTGGYFTFGRGAVGVHPMLRLTPPNRLRGCAPEHLLVGHGPPLHREVTAELYGALDRSRRDIPHGLVRLPRMLRQG